jgi:hypothetical protein
LIVFLNTNDLYSETLHCAKSTLEKLGDPIVVLDYAINFGVLQPFLENILKPIGDNE